MATLLYENDDFIAVDKPEGLAAIPERSPEKANLVTQLQEQLGCKLYVVHRLDKEVSGVILFAKNAATHKYLNDLFSEHKISKTYFAIVHGRVVSDSAVINKAVRECGSGRMAVDERRGKPSSTSYKVIRRDSQYTQLEAYPLTGRRHQIRVHLYSIGHPIVGDVRYGDKTIQSRYPRLMLHARKIRLPWPDFNSEVEIESPLPASLTVPF